MVPGTWARGLLMLNQRLKLLFSTKLMAMLATPPLTPTDTLPTLTPMVATPMLMVPDMAHSPTWDKMFTTPSIQSIHTELKLSVMARGLLMLPSCMELMAMLPPSTMVAALTLMVPSTWARGLLMLSQRLMLLFCVDLMVMLSPTHMHTLATSDTLLGGAK